jgi:leucyl/phenylalanyl-tRNA---protein transferase
MAVYRLIDRVIFPPAEEAEENGLIAVGGDLSAERLLAAYRKGIFPWYSQGEPILWWSPDPRFILFVDELHVSRSMRQFLKKEIFHITFDSAFKEVISSCSKPRPEQNGTWITAEMQDAYLHLYDLGFAHSVEVWRNGTLVGGLYGVSLGRLFFGESMFSQMPNASKAALINLDSFLRKRGFSVIDCQIGSNHLGNLGARFIPREEFNRILNDSLQYDTLRGNWGDIKAHEDNDFKAEL